MTIPQAFWNIYCQVCLLNLHYVIPAQVLCPSSLRREMLMRLAHGHEQHNQSSRKYGKHETPWELGVKWELMIEKWQVLVAYWIHSSGVFHNAISLNKRLLKDKENVLIFFFFNLGTDLPVNVPCICVLAYFICKGIFMTLLSQWDELYDAEYPGKGKLNASWKLSCTLISQSSELG